MTDRSGRLLLFRFTEVTFSALLILGSGVIYVGVAEPYLSPPALVFGEVDVLVLMLAGAGILVVRPSRFVRRRYWRLTATEAGLGSPTQNTSGTAEYTGTVQGRTIRARTGSTNALTSPSSQSTGTYTVVEAKLEHTAADGVVVGQRAQNALVTPYDVATYADCERDGVVAVSNDDDLAESILTDSLRDALSAVDDLHQLYVGNAKVAADSLPADDRTVVGTPPGITRAVDAAHDPDMTGGDWLGGNKWVTHVSDGMILDSDELQRQAEAVATAADIFDSAGSSHITE
jgi:hypothetical protein